LIKNKEHLTKEGFNKILSIRASMNLGLSDELKLVFPYINPVSRPLILNKDIKNPNWLTGFTSAEGCFSISILKSTTYKYGKAVILKFQIAQHSRDIELMKTLITFLDCGRVEHKITKSMAYFLVTKHDNITEKVISFFDKYPVQGMKFLDYSDFKKVAILMSKKVHLTKQGLSEIESIKSAMNSLRDYKNE